ncbi:prolactin receptor-like isoform X1 [Dicentrarchus labrax]|uniref:prolactin receptor-like isoform X1 n=1 Tax=Dicentrarchus labrax TaxID=13489 RepID=UPI0021F60733|nr:prolactin receptor-like isoform X1 [Dicentrarchus labrax]
MNLWLAEGGRMLWLLMICLLPAVGCNRIAAQDVYKERHSHEEVAVTMRPHIYYCRSPNMEDFTCWWHPLDNLTDGEQVTYVLTYSKDKGPKHECPDYVTAGSNSCHFDSSHTSIWKIYCMNVTAITANGNYTSQEHCLDVAEIVQTEAPVNLTHELADAGGDEMGHDALLSWTYPVPSDLKYGWITLVYELQYRRITEPDNWKVKYPLREPHVELLGLPVGDYQVRVRCRSHNSGLWSKWSSSLLMSIPARPPAGRLLVWILVSGVGVVALLVIAFGIIPQSKRIKDYFLPPIPKPRIIGIDPLLLKQKGNLDAINRHFSNFHSYRPPSYTEEVWEPVNADDIYLTPGKDCSVPVDPTDREKEALMVPYHLMPMAGHHQITTQNPSSYVLSPLPYCSSPPEAFASSLDVSSLWPRPEIVSLPGTEYSVMRHPGLPSAVPAPDTLSTNRSPQDFYTCVQLMNESGQVHLVPCLPPAYSREFPPLPKLDLDAADKEEKKKQSDYQARKNTMNRPNDGGGPERNEAADPLLPVAVDNHG